MNKSIWRLLAFGVIGVLLAGCTGQPEIKRVDTGAYHFSYSPNWGFVEGEKTIRSIERDINMTTDGNKIIVFATANAFGGSVFVREQDRLYDGFSYQDYCDTIKFAITGVAQPSDITNVTNTSGTDWCTFSFKDLNTSLPLGQLAATECNNKIVEIYYEGRNSYLSKTVETIRDSFACDANYR